MAYSYVWPPGLPQSPQKGFSEERGVLILRTPMDAGPAKMRKRGARPNTLNVSFMMTKVQVDTLDTFIQDTIKGTARFGFPHPRTSAVVETRIVPQDGGTMYSLAHVAPGFYTISLQLEILP